MNAAIWVFRKELREMWRDKRVRTNATIMPMVLVFMIMGLIGIMSDTLSKKGSLKVFIVESQNPVGQQMAKADGMKTVPTLEAGKKLIEAGEARLVLDFPAQTTAAFKIDAYFDSKEEKAQLALRAMQQAVHEIGKKQLEATLQEHGIPAEMAEPLQIRERPITIGSKESAAAFLIQMLPYLIVIWAFYGGMGIVGDLVAGEKEKLTLETLLISPVARRDIALGKFFALTVICTLSATSALVGFLVIGSAKIQALATLFPNGLGVTPTAVLAILAVLIPTAALFASIMLAVSTLAKNLREAQTHLALLSFVVLAPAMFSQVIGYMDISKTLGIYFIPVLNSSAVLRAALQGKLEALPFLITIVTSLVLALIAIRISVRLFEREQVLVRI